MKSRPLRMDGTVRPTRQRRALVKPTYDGSSMMVLGPEKRREYFTKQYMIELGRMHAAGKCSWPIERLNEMALKMVAGLADGSAEIGDAAKATCRAFGIKSTYAAVREFLSAIPSQTASQGEKKP